jgi:hypothetical protein
VRLTKREYQLLNSCADDWEVFYFLFAAVNYGGQVFPRSKGPGYAQYTDEREWSVTTPATQVAADIVALSQAGLLECRRSASDGTRHPVAAVSLAEFEPYRDYRCVTFEDHVAAHGYGPHEFRITDGGRREVGQQCYEEYDRQLGWY